MTQVTSNVGETGIKSVRIADMKIEDLPIRESALAAAQIPLLEDAERQTKIEALLAGKPKQRVAYLKSRINECEENIQRIMLMKDEQRKNIEEYIGYISLCNFRDKEIERLNKNDSNYDKKVKDLFKQFPPYNVEKMFQQIKQWEEAIERADGVIAQEHESIAEFREVLVVCIERDIQLRNLGVQLAVG